MWSSEVEYVVLEKGEKGLGFSILDYQVIYPPISFSGFFSIPIWSHEIDYLQQSFV